MLTLTMAALLPLSSVAQPDPASIGNQKYKGLYVFGDSLSDTGNDHILTTAVGATPAIPPPASYYRGRFSNGAVAMEFLWRGLTKNPEARLVSSLERASADPRPGVSYAFGGSGSGGMTTIPGTPFQVPGVQVQTQIFANSLGGARADQNAVYAVWTGANDYLLYGVTDPAAVVANIDSALRQLYALGARRLLVPNLPDLGTTPLAQAQQATTALSQLTTAHNAMLGVALARLQRDHRDATVTLVDIHASLNALAAKGAIQLWPPVLETVAPNSADCLLRAPGDCPEVDFSAPLPPLAYWDVIHPTTLVHEAMAQAMLRQMGE